MRETHQQYVERKRNDPRSIWGLINQALNAQDRDDDQYWDAVVTLWYRDVLETVEAAASLCTSNSSTERELGADILGQLGAGGHDDAFHEERLSILLGLLEQEQDPDVLPTACVACGHLHDLRAVAPVAQWKNHPHEDVRYGVALGLLGQEDALAVSTLIELTEDTNSDVRDWATFGLGSQIEVDTPGIRAALIARLVDEDDDTRGEALIGLARRGDQRVIAPLIAEIESQKVGSMALEAATLVADSILCPVLLELKAEIGEDSELEEALSSCNCESQ